MCIGLKAIWKASTSRSMVNKNDADSSFLAEGRKKAALCTRPFFGLPEFWSSLCSGTVSQKMARGAAPAD